MDAISKEAAKYKGLRGQKVRVETITHSNKSFETIPSTQSKHITSYTQLSHISI